MRSTVMEEREVLTCDGCDYILGLTTEEKEAGVDVEDTIAKLTIPWKGKVLEFLFHIAAHRHDCFRYWAHNPGIMKKSLADRDFIPSEVDEFMSTFLYREHSHEPGITRSEKTQRESYFEDGVA